MQPPIHIRARADGDPRSQDDVDPTVTGELPGTGDEHGGDRQLHDERSLR